ncbi:MAG TPA: hypothetical protein ENK09_09845 [Nitrospirae bacterium]|nr:hypothetical protein [Nitrospirota bacterium]
MRIDPLVFLFILEALALLGGAVLYLLYRLKRQGNLKDASYVLTAINELSMMLDDEITRTSNELADINGQGGDGKLLEMKLVILQRIAEDVKKGSDLKSIFGTFTSAIEKLTENPSEKKQTDKTEMKPVPDTPDESGPEQDLRIRVEEIFKKQRRSFAEILATQEITEQLKNKFSQLKDMNTELLENMTTIKDNGASGEEIDSIVRSLEQTNRELVLCVETLEKENDRLFKKLKAYEEEFEKMHNQFMEIIEDTTMNGNTEETEALRDMLKERDREVEDLRKQLKDLEAEYMVLYKQLHS